MQGKIAFFFLAFCCLFCFNSFAQDAKPKVILLISEQNIEGPQQAWWANEIDLSIVETTIAKQFISRGIVVVEPSDVSNIIKQDKAFRTVNITEEKSVKLGKSAKADYVVTGKAVSSCGNKVPQSNMVSCYANVTAKFIRIKDGKVIAYLDASGNSAHMDKITGGKEALINAADDLAGKLVDALKKEGEK